MKKNLVYLVLIAVLANACAFAAVRKGDSPEDYYVEGMANFERELWQESATAFAALKAKFPYSKYAALAEIRLADIKFASEKYLEAVDAYRLFVQYHPSHEEVPFAMYREALSHFHEIGDDWFFLPPQHEKDQTAAHKAANAFTEFLERYPKDKNAPDAKKRLIVAQGQLAAHDLYVARFYRRLGKHRGAAQRYEYIRKNFPGLSVTPAVLLELGETYVKLGEKDKARPVLAELTTDHPETGEAKDAKKILEKLQAK